MDRIRKLALAVVTLATIGVARPAVAGDLEPGAPEKTDDRTDADARPDERHERSVARGVEEALRRYEVEGHRPRALPVVLGQPVELPLRQLVVSRDAHELDVNRVAADRRVKPNRT